MAICRALVSVAGGVGSVFIIFQSGWKAEKCRGTSGPNFSNTHWVKLSNSASESFSPGISKVVISNQTNSMIEVLGKGFQVNVRRVHVPVKFGAWFWALIAR